MFQFHETQLLPTSCSGQWDFLFRRSRLIDQTWNLPNAAFLIGAIIPAWGNRCVEHTALSLDLDSAFYSCY